MYKYWTNEQVGDDKFRIIIGSQKSLIYLETVHNNYRHRDYVDPQNTKFQAHIALE